MGDPVEIKVNLAGSVEQALSMLDLEGGSERQVWFLEDTTPGLDPALPLLAAGIILRVRSGTSEDSTVKLRPCRRTQLTADWSEGFEDKDDFEYRVEEDWAGPRRSLAASAVQELDPGAMAVVTEEESDPSSLFGKQQKQFLRDCADLRINLEAVTPLGPVRATTWKGIAIGDDEANIERWQVGDLDVLELSIRVDDDPEDHQRRFEAAVRSLGLPIDKDHDSKTRRVLLELTRGSAWSRSSEG
jgi:hypothetical protein